jgi:hypothetical protein
MIDFDGLNDSQRIIILQSRMLNNEDKVTKHHKILLEGNGELPLVERVRNLEAFTTSLKFWLRTVAVAIVLQTITFGTAAVVYFVKLYPVLEKLVKQP